MLRAFKILQLLVESDDYISERYTYWNNYEDVVNFTDNFDGYSYTIYRKGDKICVDRCYEIFDLEDEFLLLIGNIDKIEIAEELLSSCTFSGCRINEFHATYYFKKYEKIYELFIDSDFAIRVSYINDDGSSEFYDKFRKSENTSVCTFEDFVNSILSI